MACAGNMNAKSTQYRGGGNNRQRTLRNKIARKRVQPGASIRQMRRAIAGADLSEKAYKKSRSTSYAGAKKARTTRRA